MILGFSENTGVHEFLLGVEGVSVVREGPERGQEGDPPQLVLTAHFQTLLS